MLFYFFDDAHPLQLLPPSSSFILRHVYVCSLLIDAIFTNTQAEIALVPHFYRFVALLEQFWSFKLVDVDQRVTKLYEAAIQRQAFKETAPDLNKFIPATVARYNLQPLR